MPTYLIAIPQHHGQTDNFHTLHSIAW